MRSEPKALSGEVNGRKKKGATSLESCTTPRRFLFFLARLPPARATRGPHAEGIEFASRPSRQVRAVSMHHVLISVRRSSSSRTGTMRKVDGVLTLNLRRSTEHAR